MITSFREADSVQNGSRANLIGLFAPSHRRILYEMGCPSCTTLLADHNTLWVSFFWNWDRVHLLLSLHRYMTIPQLNSVHKPIADNSFLNFSQKRACPVSLRDRLSFSYSVSSQGSPCPEPFLKLPPMPSVRHVFCATGLRSERRACTYQTTPQRTAGC